MADIAAAGFVGGVPEEPAGCERDATAKVGSAGLPDAGPVEDACAVMVDCPRVTVA